MRRIVEGIGCCVFSSHLRANVITDVHLKYVKKGDSLVNMNRYVWAFLSILSLQNQIISVSIRKRYPKHFFDFLLRINDDNGQSL